MHLQSILRRLHPLPGFVYGKVDLRRTAARPRSRFTCAHARARAAVAAIAARSGPATTRSTSAASHSCRYGAWPSTSSMPCAEWTALAAVSSSRRCLGRRARCRRPTRLAGFSRAGRRCCRGARWPSASTRPGTPSSACVEHTVRWGLAHRNLDGVLSIGVDEFAWKKRHKYLTLVYQIDHGCKRLLHVARDRTVGSFNTFFDMLGDDR